MLKMTYFVSGVIILALIGAAVFYYTLMRSYANPYSKQTGTVQVLIEQGDTVWDIGRLLAQKRLVQHPLVFVVGAWRDGATGNFQAGQYVVNQQLSAQEIALLFTDESAGAVQVRVTFPEGWEYTTMAERLSNLGLPGEAFSQLSTNPPADIRAKYDFLNTLPEDASLEGYLFPDTYFFLPEDSAQQIVERMLENFDAKMTPELLADIESRGKTLHEIIIMASIVEMEVQSTEDRKIVSGIFWDRLNQGVALQSDATLAYVLGERKVQHSAEDLQFESPYNSYRNKELPPGPIANPSLDAILAAIYPLETSYFYFLSDPETSETYFAETFEAHQRNKQAVGL